jgi:hypothetical protein
MLLFFGLGFYALFWVVRLGVRHGLADHEARRAPNATSPPPDRQLDH